jgi:hypothetical protein
MGSAPEDHLNSGGFLAGNRGVAASYLLARVSPGRAMGIARDRNVQHVLP